jgi:hypothetical protein
VAKKWPSKIFLRCQYFRISLMETAARAGIEPVLAFFQACAETVASEIEKSADAQLRAQKLAELQEIISAWPKLSPELRAACLAVTRAVK